MSLQDPGQSLKLLGGILALKWEKEKYWVESGIENVIIKIQKLRETRQLQRMKLLVNNIAILIRFPMDIYLNLGIDLNKDIINPSTILFPGHTRSDKKNSLFPLRCKFASLTSVQKGIITDWQGKGKRRELKKKMNSFK